MITVRAFHRDGTPAIRTEHLSEASKTAEVEGLRTRSTIGKIEVLDSRDVPPGEDPEKFWRRV